MQHGRRFKIRNPAIGIGEISKQRVEVSVEAGPFTYRRERLAHPAAPPFPLQASKLAGRVPGSEGQTGRRTESAAKTGGDGVLGSVEAESAREAGVGASDRLARLEQRACGVEECGKDHANQLIVALLNVKPCAGFTLPRQGSALHPVTNRKIRAARLFLSGVTLASRADGQGSPPHRSEKKRCGLTTC